MDSILDSLTSLFFGIVAAFSPSQPENAYFGYVEGDYVYIAAQQDGIIEGIEVRDGDQVKTGDTLATLDRADELDALAAAEAGLAAAQAQLADLQTGARAEELAVIEAKRQQAAANLTLARLTFNRTDELVSRRALPESRRDQDQAALNEASGTLRQHLAELDVARLPAREHQQEASRQRVTAAEITLSQALTDLAERRLTAPADAWVNRVYLAPGEYAKAGTPVLSLLPPDEVKIRFFLPQAVFSRISPGDLIYVSCDGCPPDSSARITYLSSEVEFTPPVIFSREERQKLVFMVEAVPENPADWHPGQPVEVRLTP